jgi:hypothetical protein
MGPSFSLYSMPVEEACAKVGVLMGHTALIQPYLDAGSLVAPLDLPAVDSGISLLALVPGMGAGSAVLKEEAWLKG